MQAREPVNQRRGTTGGTPEEAMPATATTLRTVHHRRPVVNLQFLGWPRGTAQIQAFEAKTITPSPTRYLCRFGFVSLASSIVLASEAFSCAVRNLNLGRW